MMYTLEHWIIFGENYKVKKIMGFPKQPLNLFCTMPENALVKI